MPRTKAIDKRTKTYRQNKQRLLAAAIKPAHDPVNHPAHYTGHPSGIECIEITRHMNFNKGNALKYIWRAGKKVSEIQDLEKAIWYLNDEIGRLRK